MRKLNQTFITPFDREDIHRLASSVDDILDFVNGAAARMQMYKDRATAAGRRPTLRPDSPAVRGACQGAGNAGKESGGSTGVLRGDQPS